jgi:hypothetical protein
VLDGILEGEDATLGLRLVADVGVLLAHAHHHALKKNKSALFKGGIGDYFLFMYVTQTTLLHLTPFRCTCAEGCRD